MLFDLFSEHNNPYLGAVIYLILPVTATAGVIVAVIGALWERGRRARRPERGVSPWPIIDLNRPV